MPSLRLMRNADLEQVNLVQSRAFTGAKIAAGIAACHVPLYRNSYLQMYRQANPSGAFVIVHQSKIIAYCFTRIWGSIAWLGPLAVLPEAQGRGHGTAILQAVIERLKQQGAKVIGLELDADLPNNMDFYSKRGFEVSEFVADLTAGVTIEQPERRWPDIEVLRFSEQSGLKRKVLIKNAGELSQQNFPKSDYSQELELHLDYDYGEALFLQQNERLVGLVSGHTEPYSDAEERKLLRITLTLVRADQDTDFLSGLLFVTNQWARAAGLENICFHVPEHCEEFFRFLLQRGFGIVRNHIRMTLAGYAFPKNKKTLSFSRWQ